MHWKGLRHAAPGGLAWTCIVLSLLHLGGCDRGKSSTAPPPAPGSSTAPAAPSTSPSTQPASVLTIDGKSVQFPPAKLVLTKKAGGLEAILCTDDPPTAIEPGYRGNSFMIEMKLDIEDPADLPSAIWEFKSPNNDLQDSTTGIFLNGARRQMQPADVKVTFARQGDSIVASIAGTFLIFEAHDVAAPVEKVPVKGTLDAVVHEQ